MTATLPAEVEILDLNHPNPLVRDWLSHRAARRDPLPQPARRPAPIGALLAAAPRTAPVTRADWHHLPATRGRAVRTTVSIAPRSAAADRTPRRGARISELLVHQSRALDAAAGRPQGHALRTAYICLRLTEVLGRDDATKRDVIQAALLKDLGGLSELTTLARLLAEEPIDVPREHVPLARNLPGLVRLVHETTAGLPLVVRAARLARLVHLHAGWRRRIAGVRYHRSAGVAARIGFSTSVTAAIAATGERWDGRGSPLGLSGVAVPEVARLVAVATTADLMLSRVGPAGAERGLRMRAGGALDPTLARLAADTGRLGLWRELDSPDLAGRLLALEPDGSARDGEAGLARRLARATQRIARLAEGAGADLAFHGFISASERSLGATA